LARIDNALEMRALIGPLFFAAAAVETGRRTSSFEDPDGHIWEVIWMNPSAIPAAG
jgi:predicted lactoylglutathione lyase